jgi:hypothetical protein
LLGFAVATIVISLIVSIIDVTAINRGGLRFFVFRNAGAGAGNGQDLDDPQGPGQPDAPGAHKAAAVQTAPTKAATPTPSASQK